MEKIISEINKFLETNNDKAEVISNIIEHLDIASQYEVLDSIDLLINERHINAQEAIELIFNDIITQMGYRLD